MRKVLIALICAVAGGLALIWLVWSPAPVRANAGASADQKVYETTFEPVDVYDSRFEVEVLVHGRPLQEYFARGRHYVEALEGAEYELRIRNPLGVRVAVALSVDGMNTIDARRTTAWNASKWVIAPYQTITISGWQVSGERARRFYFTSERNSYGAKLGQTANLGVISAVFYREREPVGIITPPRYPRQKDDERARTEEKQSSPDSAASSAGRGDDGARTARRPNAYPAPDEQSAATGIGRNTRNDVRWVNLELESRPAGEITVRYEYREGLVRLGILPRPYPYPGDALPRRERSTGFEDRRYSPEP
jgi:hypothetical protein